MYFSSFPKILYKTGTTEYDDQLTTNVLFRVGILNSIKNNIFAYIPYQIKNGERPETLASRFYKNSQLDWLIILANDMTDPIHDWPKDNYAFDNYIVSKYGSLANATATIHHYEKRILRRVNQEENLVTLEIDQDTYNDLAEIAYTTYNLSSGSAVEVTTSRHAISAYEWEFNENVNRHNIKLIRPDYVPQIMREFKELTNQAKGKPLGYRTIS